MKTKNKLLMITFTLVAFLSFGVMNVKADESLGDVTFDGTGIIPVVGSAPQTLTVPANAPYEIVAEESGWFDADGNNRVSSFTVDTAYTYKLQLRPKEEHVFHEDALLSITGIYWRLYASEVDSDGILKFNSSYFVASTTGVNHTIDGSLIRPVVGKTPASLELMLPEEAPYQVQLDIWYLSTPPTPYTGNFVDGDGYEYALALCPKEGSGFTFGANDTLTISGIPWKKFGFIVSPNPALEGCMAASASYVAAPIAIKEANISDIIVPIEGGLPQHDSGIVYPNTAFDTPGGSGFYKNSTDTTAMDYMTPFVENDNIFYKSVFQVIPGYFIDENTVFKYNGEIIPSANITENSGVYTAVIPFTVQPLVYDFLLGNNLSTGNLDELIFKIDADYSLFSTGGKVYVDGLLVDEANYTSREGSTIITLDEDFAATLGEGEHILNVAFINGGSAETRFTIENQTAPEVGPEEDEIPTTSVVGNPQTGDNIALFIVLGILSVMGIVGATFYAKKRFN